MEDVPGDRVVLRHPRPADVDDLVAVVDDPLVRRFVPALPVPYTRADAERWVTETVPAAWAAGDAWFAVTEPGDGRLVGQVGVFGASAYDVASTGYLIGAAYRGRGLATAAVRAVTDWAFGHGVARLELETDVDNVASQHVAHAAGYRRECVRRGAGARRDGGRRDLVAFARLAGDPAGPVARLLPDLPCGELSDGVVTLRPLVADDTASLHRLSGLPDVVATRVPPEAMSEEEARGRCTSAVADWIAGDLAQLAIRDASSGEFLGEISLHYQAPRLGQAMLGYAMLPEHRRRGHVGRAIDLVAGWAFDSVGIVRVTAGTHAGNAASQRTLERAGFSREGVQRHLLPNADGTRTDNVMFVRLRTDRRQLTSS
ncbi:MAG: GNAT family N-acetyltransferase [Streptosporangiales bacterium]|nr:GNAT family N-acetyltransferase [Streptosporangiales bacterium]